MERFYQLLDDKIQSGDWGNPEFRKRAYDKSRSAMQRAVAKNNAPEAALQKLQQSLEAAILDIEKKYGSMADSANTDQSEIGLDDTIPTNAHGTHIPEPAIIGEQKMSSNSSKSTILALVGAVAVIGVGGWLWSQNSGSETMETAMVEQTETTNQEASVEQIISDSSTQVETKTEEVIASIKPEETETPPSVEETETQAEVLETEPEVTETASTGAEIKLLIGEKVRTKGTAERNDTADLFTFADNSVEKTQDYRWIATNVEANKRHSIRLVLPKDNEREGNAQLQIVYAMKGATTAVYTYLLNVSTGVVIPRNAAAGDRFTMTEQNGEWMLDINTKSLEIVSAMQIILRPSPGKDATGELAVKSLIAQDATS